MNIINGKEVSKKTREKVALMVKDFIAEVEYLVLQLYW